MCYDFDAYLAKARIAEQMRMKKRVAEDQEKQRGTTAPAAPGKPEKQGKDHEPVPA
jgi:hypothetical protein